MARAGGDASVEKRDGKTLMDFDDDRIEPLHKDEAFIRSSLDGRRLPEPSPEIRRNVLKAAHERASGRSKTARQPEGIVRMRRLLYWGVGLAAAATLMIILLRPRAEIRPPAEMKTPAPDRATTIARVVPPLVDVDNRLVSARARLENLRPTPSDRSRHADKRTAHLLRRTLRLKKTVGETTGSAMAAVTGIFEHARI